MAARTLYPSQDAGPTNWSAGSWSEADDNAKDQAKPTAEDTVIFTANSGAIDLDENSAALVSFIMIGYASTLAMATNNIDSQGDVGLDGTITADDGAVLYCGGDLVLTAGMTFDVDLAIVMDVETGSKSIYTDGITIGDLTIDDAAGDADFSLTDALTCADFILTDGAFGTGDYAFTANSIAGSDEGGELDFGDSTVAITDAFDTAGIETITSGACTITVPSVTIDSNADIDTTWTLTGDTVLEGDFTLAETAGTTTLDTDGNELYCSGDVAYSGGTVTELLLTITGPKDLTWNAAVQPITLLTVSGTPVTFVAAVYCEALAGAGELALGGRGLTISYPSDDFWVFTGDITGAGSIQITMSADRQNLATIDVGTATTLLLYTTVANRTLTVGDIIADNTINLYSTVAPNVATINITGSLTCGTLTPGRATGQNRSGKVILSSNTHVIGAIASGHAENLLNAIHLGSCYLEITGGGELDFDNIAVDCDDGACHIEGLGAATVSNTDAASTADGAPVKDNGTTTVTVDDDIFNSDMVGRKLKFDATSNEFAIASYTNTKVVVVTGDASGEGDGDTVTISNVNGDVHTHHCTDGGGNNETTDAEVTFDTHISPAGINAAMAAA